MIQPGVAPAAESPLGSVFNVDFSPDDKYVVAVFARNAFEVYDPRLDKKVHSHRNAHEDCVNCVTFISDVQFATCSDDSDIRLWDARNLSSSLSVLRGSLSWVKNVEYDRNSGLLFSIAFNDGVRYWDLDNVGRYETADANLDNCIQTLRDPVRMRIAPDGTKMFITSRKNTCLVINDFDGARFSEVEVHIGDVVRKALTTHEELESLSHNRPTLHTICGRLGARKDRIVMSATFHPSSDLVGLRFTDVNESMIGNTIIQETTILYDLRPETYSPYVTPDQAHDKYLRYVDDPSPEDSTEFIKEICFSRDGRVLASPYKDGVRLFAVDPICTPADIFFEKRYHSSYKDYACLGFEEIMLIPSIHSSSVLTCSFAHTDYILASGSLAGTIAFSSPQI